MADKPIIAPTARPPIKARHDIAIQYTVGLARAVEALRFGRFLRCQRNGSNGRSTTLIVATLIAIRRAASFGNLP